MLDTKDMCSVTKNRNKKHLKLRRAWMSKASGEQEDGPVPAAAAEQALVAEGRLLDAGEQRLRKMFCRILQQLFHKEVHNRLRIAANENLGGRASDL